MVFLDLAAVEFENDVLEGYQLQFGERQLLTESSYVCSQALALHCSQGHREVAEVDNLRNPVEHGRGVEIEATAHSRDIRAALQGHWGKGTGSVVVHASSLWVSPV